MYIGRYEFLEYGSTDPTTFSTPTIECDGTSKPVLDYEFVHSFDKVTPEFIGFLGKPLEVRVYVSPDAIPPKDPVGTTNEIVKENVINRRQVSGTKNASTNASGSKTDETLKAELIELRARQELLAAENQSLKKEVKTLKLQKRVALAGTAAARKHFGQDSSQACSVQ